MTMFILNEIDLALEYTETDCDVAFFFWNSYFITGSELKSILSLLSRSDFCIFISFHFHFIFYDAI